MKVFFRSEHVFTFYILEYWILSFFLEFLRNKFFECLHQLLFILTYIKYRKAVQNLVLKERKTLIIIFLIKIN
jgi:hypothetical protein